MTQSKREPFAKATKHPTLDTWLVADAAGNNLCWADDSQAWEQWDAESRANSINAAFNARVDEEVRKAVEEFRERAARSVEVADLFEDVENGCPAEMPEATRPGFSAVGWIAKKIRALPTEPEGK